MFFKRKPKKVKFGFLFKNGVEVIIECDKLKIESKGNELVSYEIEGGKGEAFYFRLDDISAIIRR